MNDNPVRSLKGSNGSNGSVEKHPDGGEWACQQHFFYNKFGQLGKLVEVGRRSIRKTSGHIADTTVDAVNRVVGVAHSNFSSPQAGQNLYFNYSICFLLGVLAGFVLF